MIATAREMTSRARRCAAGRRSASVWTLTRARTRATRRRAFLYSIRPSTSSCAAKTGFCSRSSTCGRPGRSRTSGEGAQPRTGRRTRGTGPPLRRDRETARRGVVPRSRPAGSSSTPRTLAGMLRMLAEQSRLTSDPTCAGRGSPKRAEAAQELYPQRVLPLATAESPWVERAAERAASHRLLTEGVAASARELDAAEPSEPANQDLAQRADHLARRRSAIDPSLPPFPSELGPPPREIEILGPCDRLRRPGDREPCSSARRR